MRPEADLRDAEEGVQQRRHPEDRAAAGTPSGSARSLERVVVLAEPRRDRVRDPVARDEAREREADHARRHRADHRERERDRPRPDQRRRHDEHRARHAERLEQPRRRRRTRGSPTARARQPFEPREQAQRTPGAGRSDAPSRARRPPREVRRAFAGGATSTERQARSRCSLSGMQSARKATANRSPNSAREAH